MIVTLLTDLGTKDATVANIKAALAQRNPEAEVADLSHEVTRHNWREAAYLLASAYSSFPEGTIHVIPVGPFMERAPRMIIAKKDGHYFIAPDNGLLYAALGGEAMNTVRSCHTYNKPYDMSQWVEDAAVVISEIASGWVLPYPPFKPDMPVQLPTAQVTPIGIACRIVRIDRYHNVVLNIRKAEFEKITNGKPFKIRTFKAEPITAVSRHYNDVPEKTPLCRFNKMGFLEIAVNHGSAMELFGIDPTDPNAADYHTIRISL